MQLVHDVPQDLPALEEAQGNGIVTVLANGRRHAGLEAAQPCQEAPGPHVIGAVVVFAVCVEECGLGMWDGLG